MFKNGILGEMANEKQRHIIDIMLRNVDRLLDMSMKYLRLSKIESGELEIVKRKMNIFTEAVSPVVKSEKMRLEEKGMHLRIENESRFREIEVEADPVLIMVVYTNLISNAIRYGKTGGEITIGYWEDEKNYYFYVKNEGKGIPKDKLSVIFEKFVRLEEETQIKGSGLGLYNTKEIIERHGGKIWAESEEGKWANFIFTLPKEG